jgi:branched-chain amino acid transport system permease protein
VDTFLQQVVNGLTLGCVYAVVALGYTMVYGIIQLINFAHGEVVMIGCMVAFSVIVALAGTGMPPLAIVGIGCLVAVPRVHVGGLRRRARRLPAAAPRAAPRAAHHRDRRLDHPAAPRAPRLEPQHHRLPADHRAQAHPPRSADSSAAISNVQIAIIVRRS